MLTGRLSDLVEHIEDSTINMPLWCYRHIMDNKNLILASLQLGCDYTITGPSGEKVVISTESATESETDA